MPQSLNFDDLGAKTISSAPAGKGLDFSDLGAKQVFGPDQQAAAISPPPAAGPHVQMQEVPESTAGRMAVAGVEGAISSAKNTPIMIPGGAMVPQGVIRGGAKGGVETIQEIVNLPASVGLTKKVGPETIGIGLPADILKAKGPEETVGKGLEGIGEFMLGDEALKGIALAKRIGLVQKVAEIGQQSPRLAKALEIGMKAMRTGVVSGAQTRAHGGTAAESLESVVLGAGISGLTEGAGALYQAAKPGIKNIAGKSILTFPRWLDKTGLRKFAAEQIKGAEPALVEISDNAYRNAIPEETIAPGQPAPSSSGVKSLTEAADKLENLATQRLYPVLDEASVAQHHDLVLGAAKAASQNGLDDAANVLTRARTADQTTRTTILKQNSKVLNTAEDTLRSVGQDEAANTIADARDFETFGALRDRIKAAKNSIRTGAMDYETASSKIAESEEKLSKLLDGMNDDVFTQIDAEKALPGVQNPTTQQVREVATDVYRKQATMREVANYIDKAFITPTAVGGVEAGNFRPDRLKTQLDLAVRKMGGKAGTEAGKQKIISAIGQQSFDNLYELSSLGPKQSEALNIVMGSLGKSISEIGVGAGIPTALALGGHFFGLAGSGVLALHYLAAHPSQMTYLLKAIKATVKPEVIIPVMNEFIRQSHEDDSQQSSQDANPNAHVYDPDKGEEQFK